MSGTSSETETGTGIGIGTGIGTGTGTGTRPTIMESDDAAFVAAFEDCTLPPERFHHADHVRLAWLLLGEDDLPHALVRFCEGLKRYAASLGKAGLYHETITVAYLLLVQDRRQAGGTAETFEEFTRWNPDLFVWRPSILERYYRPETLASARAREGFVLPDRRPAA